MEEAFEKYKGEKPDAKVGLTSLKKLKAPEFKTIGETNSQTCLFQNCINATLKPEVLKSFTCAKEDFIPHTKSVKIHKMSCVMLHDGATQTIQPLTAYSDLAKVVMIRKSGFIYVTIASNTAFWALCSFTGSLDNGQSFKFYYGSQLIFDDFMKSLITEW